jgi:hypothetical protein
MTTTPRSRIQKARGLLPQVRRLMTNVRLAYERRETTATDRAWLCAFGDALDQFLSSGETTLSGGADPRTWQRARKSAPKGIFE